MDQYLLIPFWGGWTSIYQLFWCSPGVQGFDTLPNDMRFPWSSLQLIGTSCRVRRAHRLTGRCSSQRRRTSSETTSQRLRGSGWGDPEGVQHHETNRNTWWGVQNVESPIFLKFWNVGILMAFFNAGAILGAMHLSMKKCQVDYQTWDLISQHYN